jgi:glycosyltransferase involved in cell wall biosynthesis
MQLPISAIIPTRNRPVPLSQALKSIAVQGALPTEIIIVDGSTDAYSQQVVGQYQHDLNPCSIIWQAALTIGAAVQRNQGMAIATQPFICFCDDDVTLESNCLQRLWDALQSDPKLGAVNATIVNQQYHSPGAASRILFRLMNGKSESSYSGRVIGPAVNLLPEDREDLPRVVPVEWLNLGCTIYRREALPDPPFDSVFAGYSLMEDLALSLRVGRRWSLANVRMARIVHDSQPGPHKSNIAAMAAMELVNRHYVMTEILGKRRFLDYLRLCEWEMFQLCVMGIRRQGQLSKVCLGKLDGFQQICRARRRINR